MKKVKLGRWGGPLLCGPGSHDVQGLAKSALTRALKITVAPSTTSTLPGYRYRWNFQKTLYIIVFRGGDDGRGYRNLHKMPQGPTWI
jgi:hypothetical protein